MFISYILSFEALLEKHIDDSSISKIGNNPEKEEKNSNQMFDKRMRRREFQPVWAGHG